MVNRRRGGQGVGCLVRDADHACEVILDGTLHGALLVRLTRLVDALVVRVQGGRSERGGRRTQPAPLGDAAVMLKMLRLSYALDKGVRLQHRVRRRDGATTGRRRERLLDGEGPAQRYRRWEPRARARPGARPEARRGLERGRRRQQRRR
ncbi:hypothetical protein F5Y07DRAFT_404835 [Xylaria sp. FL0933]|nr:hypothetical protein F5Y07DRAFT_404835 [Xylaria sp. FL0933]